MSAEIKPTLIFGFFLTSINTVLMIHDIMIIVLYNKRTISKICLITDEFTLTFDNILSSAIEM